MDDKLAIKLNIGNRQYPLTIKRAEEEQIRKAAATINERIREFRENYAVRDMQDLLAMTALYFASDDKNLDPVAEEGRLMQEEKAAEIDALLSDYLDNQ